MVTYVVTRRLAEFRRYAHLPGPPAPSFVWGNLPDLLSEGWDGRHVALGNLLRRYGAVVAQVGEIVRPVS